MKKASVALALVLAALCSVPVTNAQRSTGESVDDTTIAVSVKTALTKSERVSANNVNVEVYKRTVQLSGFVPSRDAQSAALEIASETGGVENVLDAMVVLPGERSVGRTIDDNTIHAQVKFKIAEVSGFGDAIGVVTHVRSGDVILSGFVDSDTLHDDLIAAAESVKGVVKVHDKLAVK